jgi:hypothetical protein
MHTSFFPTSSPKLLEKSVRNFSLHRFKSGWVLICICIFSMWIHFVLKLILKAYHSNGKLTFSYHLLQLIFEPWGCIKITWSFEKKRAGGVMQVVEPSLASVGHWGQTLVLSKSKNSYCLWLYHPESAQSCLKKGEEAGLLNKRHCKGQILAREK